MIERFTNTKFILISDSNPHRLKFSNESVRNIARKVKTRLIVVRHPVNRLISGFKDIIIKENHRNESDMAIFTDQVLKRQHEKNISALESYMRQSLMINDRHFWSYEQSCSPCDIDYNVIVKLDDATETNRFFKQSAHVSEHRKMIYSLIDNPTANVNRKKERKSKLKEYLQQMNPKTVIDFLNHYRNDFELFGYKLYLC